MQGANYFEAHKAIAAPAKPALSKNHSTMATVFINYRRDDTEGHAGRLYDELKRRLDPQEVFLDVEGIGAGVDWRKSIEENLANCKLVLVLIGKHWTHSTDASGKRRLDDPEDTLRLEIVMARKLGIRVVPVLMHGAKLPAESDLPEDLRPLLHNNAFELRHDKWNSDVQLLMKDLATTIPNLAYGSASAKPGIISLQAWWGSVLAILATYVAVFASNSNETLLFVSWVVLGFSFGAWHAYRVPKNIVRDLSLGLAIALTAYVAVSFVGMVFYEQPFWPKDEAEWHGSVKHMVTIMLSFVGGCTSATLMAKLRFLRSTRFRHSTTVKKKTWSLR